MANFRIDDDLVDRIVRETLKEDYLRVKRDIRDLVERNEVETLAFYEKEDLSNFITLKGAFETLLFYYYPHDEALSITTLSV